MSSVTTWGGRGASTIGLCAWLVWLAWRLATAAGGPLGFAVLALELIAFAAALVVTAGLWARVSWAPRRVAWRPLPPVLAEALGLDDVGAIGPRGADDTGEIAWARHGLDLLGRRRSAGNLLAEAAWSVVAIDGLRRMASIVALVVVLFSGTAPYEMPPVAAAAALVGGIATLSVGHWLLSGGRLRPGDRLVWSMASVGAGLGDGVSRTGMPIRWMATMATMVALNVAVSLRGLSDRWTHGLAAMPHGPRVVAMSAAFGLVLAGFAALRTLPRPELDFYGATRRLEEDSARRLALGATAAVAVLGFVVGVLPPAPIA